MHPDPEKTAAADSYLPLVYDSLRRLARAHLNRRAPSATLDSIELVHETYLRLARGQGRWQNRSHFFAVAATQMRHVLVDRARAATAAKRSGERITLDDHHGLVKDPQIDLVVLDEALNRLGRRSRRQVRVAEMRLFAGMTVREVSEALGVSERTVKSEWRHARAWLTRRLHDGSRRRAATASRTGDSGSARPEGGSR